MNLWNRVRAALRVSPPANSSNAALPEGHLLEANRNLRELLQDTSVPAAVRQALDYRAPDGTQGGTGRAVAVCAIGFPIYALVLLSSLLLLGPWPVSGPALAIGRAFHRFSASSKPAETTVHVAFVATNFIAIAVNIIFSSFLVGIGLRRIEDQG